MKMGAPAGPWPWIGPLANHFGIDGHLIEDGYEGHVGEFFEEMIADLPGHALAVLGVHGSCKFLVLFLQKLVLKEMPVGFAVVDGSGPLLGGPQADDIGLDTAAHFLGSAHAPDLLHVDGLY